MHNHFAESSEYISEFTIGIDHLLPVGEYILKNFVNFLSTEVSITV